MKLSTIIDTCLLSLGTVYSLANIEQILGILILVVQLIWLISKLCIKIYNSVKNKKAINITQKEVEDVEQLCIDLSEKVEDFKEKDVNPKE